MKTVSVYDAKTHLSQLLGDVEQGEQITITRNGVPVARLVPVEPAAARSAAPLHGLVLFLADDAFEPMTEAEAAALAAAPLIAAS